MCGVGKRVTMVGPKGTTVLNKWGQVKCVAGTRTTWGMSNVGTHNSSRTPTVQRCRMSGNVETRGWGLKAHRVSRWVVRVNRDGVRSQRGWKVGNASNAATQPNNPGGRRTTVTIEGSNRTEGGGRRTGVGNSAQENQGT